MAVTVGDVLERLFRTYLYPPDYQPITSFLNSVLTDLGNGLWSFSLGRFAVPEDQNLVRIGSLLEIGQELFEVREFDEALNRVTTVRAQYGTPEETHAINDRVIMNPPYSRLSTFQSVADNIITLFPKLFTVSANNLVEVTGTVSGVDDPLAVEVLTVWAGDYDRSPDVHAEIIDFHPAIGGRALLTNVATGDLWLRYRRRMGQATSETDTLEELGVDEAWVNIVMVGTAADLFAGRDLPASQVEWVSAVLQAENIEVGTRAGLSVGLARYRELLIDRAQKEMGAEYKPKIKMRQAGLSNAGMGLG